MKLKIKGRTPEQVQQNLHRVLNVATVVVQRGHIPTPQDQAEPEIKGQYWYFDKSKTRCHLFGVTNDYWANVREQTPDYVVIEFSCRYDRDQVKKETLTRVIPAFFGVEVAEILD